jgi:hypothetical protein
MSPINTTGFQNLIKKFCPYIRLNNLKYTSVSVVREKSFAEMSSLGAALTPFLGIYNS